MKRGDFWTCRSIRAAPCVRMVDLQLASDVGVARSEGPGLRCRHPGLSGRFDLAGSPAPDKLAWTSPYGDLMREIGAFEGEEQTRPAARCGGARRGDCHHPTRQGGGPTGARTADRQPSRCPCRTGTHSGAGRKSQTGPLRLDRVEVVSRRRTSVSLVLDSSATLAWIYGDETTAAISSGVRPGRQ